MKLLAIDGNSIMNRAFYGIKLLSNSKGQFTNALTGFMNIYLKEIGEVKPDCVAVAFDLKAPTFRHKANAAYKANRKVALRTSCHLVYPQEAGSFFPCLYFFLVPFLILRVILVRHFLSENQFLPSHNFRLFDCWFNS